MLRINTKPIASSSHLQRVEQLGRVQLVGTAPRVVVPAAVVDAAMARCVGDEDAKADGALPRQLDRPLQPSSHILGHVSTFRCVCGAEIRRGRHGWIGRMVRVDGVEVHVHGGGGGSRPCMRAAAETSSHRKIPGEGFGVREWFTIRLSKTARHDYNRCVCIPHAVAATGSKICPRSGWRVDYSSSTIPRAHSRTPTNGGRSPQSLVYVCTFLRETVKRLVKHKKVAGADAIPLQFLLSLPSFISEQERTVEGSECLENTKAQVCFVFSPPVALMCFSLSRSLDISASV